VIDRYPDGNAWLGSINALGEWQVAYHGTSWDNLSGIIKHGFDLERCERCTYGKGIYCAPDPK
ncbi:ubiquitin 1, partial [Aphelenchoides avenae]